MSFFEADTSEVESCVRLAEDIADVENFSPNTIQKEAIENSKPDFIAREKNPIWILLNKNEPEGKRIANLSEDCILNTKEIKTVANIVADYLFSKAEIPKRQVTPSTCLLWSAKYFGSLFPQTPSHRFYFIKNEKYTTKTGKEVNKGRPSGALYTSLSLLRKKLLENDVSAKLRTTNTSIHATAQSKVSTTPQKVKRASCLRPPGDENATASYFAPGIMF